MLNPEARRVLQQICEFLGVTMSPDEVGTLKHVRNRIFKDQMEGNGLAPRDLLTIREDFPWIQEVLDEDPHAKTLFAERIARLKGRDGEAAAA